MTKQHDSSGVPELTEDRKGDGRHSRLLSLVIGARGLDLVASYSKCVLVAVPSHL
jgi:hypothetical protein